MITIEANKLARLFDHLETLEMSSESTPGNKTLAADYRALLGEIELLQAVNLSLRDEHDLITKRLTDYGPKDWVPVADLTGREQEEWLNVLLPNGKVEAAIYTEVFTDDVDGYTWCQWGENGYEPMQVQPTHFYPQPAAPLP